MAALTPGKTAPDFALPPMNGSPFSLRQALSQGPVVAVFFKISCPVCQFALPYLERIYQAYGHKSVSIIAISQNDAKGTAAFVKEYGITFPVLLENIDDYPVSNAYGLTNVPTTFWIARDGEIEVCSVGWSRPDIEEINRKIAEAGGEPLMPIFQPNESVPEFRAG